MIEEKSENLKGIILIDKPSGMTSFKVVAIARRILNIKKIGHSGTLDPNATGLLLLLLNKSTKLLPFIDNHFKKYEFSLKLGIKTDTADIWGQVIEVKPVKPLTDNDIKRVCDHFTGTYQQLPPMVSAIKVDGRKLYEYARNNEVIKRDLRQVIIKSLTIKKIDDDNYSGVVECSKGTYVRTLCEDIAFYCNNIATMTSIRRTAIGMLKINDACSLEDLDSGHFKMIDPRSLLSEYKFVDYDDIKTVFNGHEIKLSIDENKCFICYEDEIVAFYERKDNDTFHCVRGLW